MPRAWWRSRVGGTGGNGCGRGRGGGLGPDSSGSPTESSASESSDTDLFWKEIMASFVTKTRKKLKPSSKQQETTSGQVQPEPKASGQDESKPKASRREARNRDYVPAVGGGSCYFEAYPVGATGKLYENWMFVCPRPGHKGCFKTKGVYPGSTRRYDELEPLAFLHAWRDMVVPPGKTHRNCNPTAAAIDEQMAAHMAEFAELNAKFRT